MESKRYLADIVVYDAKGKEICVRRNVWSSNYGVDALDMKQMLSEMPEYDDHTYSFEMTVYECSKIDSISGRFKDLKCRKEYCYQCNDDKEFKVKIKESSLVVKGETIDFEEKIPVCLTCGNEMPISSDAFDPVKLAYAAYKRKSNLLSVEDMKSFMAEMEITQEDLCRRLGWEDRTLYRYLNGAVQDEAHDKAFRMLMAQMKDDLLTRYNALLT